jgi:hypothetical protein
LGPQGLVAAPTATILETTTTTVLEDTATAGAAEDGEGPSSPLAPEGEEGAEGEEEDEEESEAATVSSLRARGKDLHDAGRYGEAADLFRRASLRLAKESKEDGAAAGDDEEEYATCRLHEALCRLKAGGPDQAERAASACGSVLDRRDGLPNVLVARAYHRRAKARLALGRPDHALDDARSAAFLGDRKAVALYGRLMREHPGADPAGAGEAPQGGPTADSSSLLEALMSAGSISNNNNGGGGTAFPSALDGLSPGGFPFLPSLDGLGLGADGGGGSSLAGSVLSSLSKRLQDEQTQESICRFLGQASAAQVRSLAGMAGLPLGEGQADRVASFCRGVTPAALRGWIRTGRRVAAGVRLVRKLSKLVSKYRTLLIVLCVLAWAKSAVLRPVPLARAARRAQAAGPLPG